MLHRHWCNYHLSPESSLHASISRWVREWRVRGWFCSGYVSRLLEHLPQGDPGRLPSSQRIPGQRFLMGEHGSTWCHGRYKWSHEPRRDAAAWAGAGGGKGMSGMRLRGESQGAPQPGTRDGAFPGKVSPGRRSVWGVPAPAL